MVMKAKHLFLLIAVLGIVSCTKRIEQAEIGIRIGYEINGTPLITDTLCYHNEAGNTFLITEIQWFLSKIKLQDESGEWISLEHRKVNNLFPYAADKVFYIDTNIPESHRLDMSPIPVGKYKVMRFVFGLIRK